MYEDTLAQVEIRSQNNKKEKTPVAKKESATLFIYMAERSVDGDERQRDFIIGGLLKGC